MSDQAVPSEICGRLRSLTVPVSAHRPRGVWPWPLGLDRLDGDERVELLNQVFEVQNHGTAKQGQRRFEPICERWRDRSTQSLIQKVEELFDLSE
jgi:hypothetical protein